MKREDLIVERPDLQKPMPRLGWGLVTLFFWAFYFYLWMPLISLAMWSFGISFIYEHMVLLEGYRSLVQLLGAYILVIFLLGTIFLLWARVNFWRFRGVERRREPPRVTREEQAQYYGLEAARLAEWHYQSRLTVEFDQDGRITRISE